MKALANCPFCGDALRGHATLRDGDSHIAVNDCSTCGRYTYTEAEAPLVAAADDAARKRIAGFLSFMQRRADGRPVRLAQHHILGGQPGC
jgi:hypothetical protein